MTDRWLLILALLGRREAVMKIDRGKAGKMCANCGEIYADHTLTGPLSLCDLCPACVNSKNQADELRRIQAAKKVTP